MIAGAPSSASVPSTANFNRNKRSAVTLSAFAHQHCNAKFASRKRRQRRPSRVGKPCRSQSQALTVMPIVSHQRYARTNAALRSVPRVARRSETNAQRGTSNGVSTVVSAVAPRYNGTVTRRRALRRSALSGANESGTRRREQRAAWHEHPRERRDGRPNRSAERIEHGGCCHQHARWLIVRLDGHSSATSTWVLNR